MLRIAARIFIPRLTWIALTLVMVVSGCSQKKEKTKGLTGAAATVDATQSSLTINSSASVVADGVSTASVEILLKNSQNEPVIGVIPQLALSGSGGVAGVCPATDADGLSVCEVASTKAETKVVSISWPIAKSGGSGASVLFVAGAAEKVCFQIQPGGGMAGFAWIFQPSVIIGDSHCNKVSSGAQAVTLALISGTGSVLGTTTEFAASGLAQFSSLSMNISGVKSLQATAPGLTSATSSAFEIFHGDAHHLGFSVEPGGGAASLVWSTQPQVEIQDFYGNRVLTSQALVVLSLTNGTGVLSGSVSRMAQNGVARFNNLSLDKIGTDKELSAVSVGLVGASSDPFTITLGAPAKLGFINHPGGGSSGVVWAVQPTVQVYDAGGNLIPTATNSISLSLSQGAGFINGTTTVPAVAGLASFSGLSISTAGANKIITASSTGLQSALSNVFIITAGLASKLCVSAQPGGAVAGVNLSVQPKFFIGDNDCTIVTSETSTISLSISSGGGSLSGPSSQAAIAGEAQFAGLSVQSAGTKIITASAAGLASVTTNSFVITPAITSAAVSSAMGSGAAVWADGSDQGTVTVILKDAFGNLISGRSVTLTSNRGGSDSIVGSPAITNALGEAVFPVKSTLAGTSIYTVVAEGVTLLDAPMLTFQSTAVDLAQSSWEIFPGSMAANGVSEGTLTVRLKNSLGNVLANKSVSVSSSRGVQDTILGSPGLSDVSGEVKVRIKSGLVGESDLTISIPADSATFATLAPVHFYSSAPLLDWQARLPGSSLIHWKDWAAGISADLKNFDYDANSGWGSGFLRFDGFDDQVSLGNSFNNLTQISIDAWIKPLDSGAGGDLIFSNSDLAGHGLTLRQAWDSSGRLELSLGGYGRTYMGQLFDLGATVYIPLDEAVGGTASSTLGGVSGSYNNVTLAQPSALTDNRKSVSFNGSSSSVNFGDNYEGTADQTVSAWVYPTSNTGTRPILSKMPLLGLGGYSLDISGGKARFRVINTLVLTHTVTSTTTLPLNQWSHVAAVRDDAQGKLRIYVNGVMEDETSVILGGVGVTGEDFLIGKQGLSHFEGRIDEVSLYDFVLGDNDIASKYAARLHPACYSQSALTNNVWSSLAVTFDEGAQDLKLYMNGAAGAECSLVTAGIAYQGSNYPMALGGAIDNLGANVEFLGAWQGLIGEIKFFPSILSGAQLNTHYGVSRGRY